MDASKYTSIYRWYVVHSDKDRLVHFLAFETLLPRIQSVHASIHSFSIRTSNFFAEPGVFEISLI